MQILTSAGGHFEFSNGANSNNTFIGTYIPDFNSIPSAVLEKKFLENRPIRIFKDVDSRVFSRMLSSKI